jgi:TonB family protein
MGSFQISNRESSNRFGLRLAAIMRAIVAGVIASAAFVAVGQEKSEAASAKDLDELTGRLVAQLRRENVRTVAIFDLKTLDGKQIAFGSWLADRISEDVSKAGAGIDAADREKLRSFDSAGEKDAKKQSKLYAEKAKSADADAYVRGTFGAIGDGIGITLIAERVSGKQIRESKWAVDTAAGKIALDDEVQSHLGVAIESLRPSDGIYAPGTAGVSAPECEYCPQPEFTDDAVRAKVQALVVLDVVISSEGKAIEIRIKQGFGYGLDRNAVNGVRAWRFKPAYGPDGKPVAVHQVVEITFKLG